MAFNFGERILQRFQSKTLPAMVDAPWYISRNTLHHDLKIPTVREEIQRVRKMYIPKLETHPNFFCCESTRQQQRILQTEKT